MTLKKLENKHIHFIGIGGIGMSGIAQLMVQEGFQVSGSDLSVNEHTKRLQEKGIAFSQGHAPSHLKGKDVIVVSTGIQEDNPELKEARRLDLPILHRAEMLALLIEKPKAVAISGTHGKTTTTALIGWILEIASFDPTVINGGVMNVWGSNVKRGRGEWTVVEADESDGSFLKLPKEIALVTNMDCEHMDYYGSAQKLQDAFETFATTHRGHGVAVLGIDHPSVYSLWKKIKSTQTCLTFGLHAEADVRAENIQAIKKGLSFELLKGTSRFKVELPLQGKHNILNALGAATVALECGVREEALREALSSFEGVQRRFTHVGEWQGVTIIDDYAHHPVEIRATLEAAKNAQFERVIAVLEPHRYSRLESHFDDFARCCDEADLSIVLPVYSAQELPRKGIDHKALVASMQSEAYCCDHVEDLPRLIKNLTRAGDVVVCLGAGSISSLARKLPMQLTQYSQSKNGTGEET